MAPQHGSLSLYTKLKCPSIVRLDFDFAWYGLWNIFKGPYIFIFMALGLCGKRPLSTHHDLKAT